MKHILYIILFLLGCPYVAAQQTDYDVYLLIGQSNMAGRGTLLDSDRIPMEGVWLLNDKDEPEVAVPPLNRYSTIRKEMKMQQMGLGVSFAQTMHQKTGRKVLLVVNARGGSSILHWQKGDSLRYYEEAVRRTKAALRYGSLKAILWHQGETDVKQGSRYIDYFQQLITGLRSELGTPQLPVVVGELGHWGWADENQIRYFNQTVLPTICRQIPHVSGVSAEGLPRLSTEKDPHFSREGQLELGRRYADSLLNQQINPDK